MLYVSNTFFYSRNRLENLSKTDLEQGWGKCTNAAQDEYKKGMCVKDFCHVKSKRKLYNISQKTEETNFQLLLNCKKNILKFSVVSNT